MLYTPPAFKVEDLGKLHAHIAATGLATLVTASAAGPIASHVPLFLETASEGYGRLIGHLARANLQWRDSDLAQPALAIFMGPDAYVSPSWYPAKKEHGRVVPTWNYAVVHARGTLTVHDDAAWLHAAVDRLTSRHEAAFDAPWRTSDAPERFMEMQLKGIVGIELEITSLEGKYKLSQNRAEADQTGVVEGLGARDDIGSAATRALMQARQATK